MSTTTAMAMPIMAPVPTPPLLEVVVVPLLEFVVPPFEFVVPPFEAVLPFVDWVPLDATEVACVLPATDVDTTPATAVAAEMPMVVGHALAGTEMPCEPTLRTLAVVCRISF
jgi:hypothetical protein